jgi:hypothetical protein
MHKPVILTFFAAADKRSFFTGRLAAGRQSLKEKAYRK